MLFKLLITILIVLWSWFFIYGGIYIYKMLKKNRGYSGQLVIDTTDMTKDIYRLVVFDDFESLKTKKYIKLEVKQVSELSQDKHRV